MLEVASTVAASPEEVSVTSLQETLTPAQKAARTRAANKARKEAELAAAAAAEQ
ncbi:capsid and scaffold protein [Escherichia phage vB_EcoP_PHB20]|uniref:Capsid and scaffold protein n=2 Tax=Teseptimavirus IME390 TaxID=2733870 RepID=A0A386KDF3_9CAUD|nr:head protein [Enterobacteria phage vB_EcoP_IME390]AYD82949.1 capsid and scaffold protein [Enterobacteria phage vB_EcoP_IME390]QHI00815.1 capsid and scaffold protein [Escherichia phage vB_EcoP_PHB20]